MAQQHFEDFVNLARPSGANSISGDIDVPVSEDDLFRILECPVCAEFPSPPIYSCARGHFICNACMAILDACTTCGEGFTTRIRNYALEQIVERTKFKCRYKSDGCEESIMGEDYLKHATECVFRPLKCSQNGDSACQLTSFSQQMYLQHLITCHDMDGQIIDGAAPDLFGIFTQRLADQFPSFYLKFEGRPFNQSFLLHTRKYKSYVCWWVTSLSMENIDCKVAVLNWTKVHLDATPNSVRQKFTMKWKLSIQHENRSFEEIRDGATCAVIPLQHLRQFEDQDNPDNEIRWIVGLEIEDKIDEKRPNANFLAVNNADWPMWPIIRHYSPLLALLFVGIVLCIYFGLQDESVPGSEESSKGNKGSDEDEYYGYRGFYFREPPNEF